MEVMTTKIIACVGAEIAKQRDRVRVCMIRLYGNATE